MPHPDAYPEMILAAAQEEIQALAHVDARRAARATRRSWRQSRIVRCIRTLI